MLKYKHLIGLRHGFTIPFLVGAYYKLGFIKDETLLSSDCIRDIITYVLESATSENPVKILDCSDLYGEPVLQYLATGLSEEHTQDQRRWDSNIDKKFYWHPKESEVRDLDTLIEWLWEKTAASGDIQYSELISSGRFSCSIKHWSPFNEKEEKFIKHISLLDTVNNLNSLY